ncbi:hypothetical protein N8D56_23450 [Devosia sp. A8/3-2]|nr:hypothetical protein N8D56_23450 [Devosia sp. A8/3-2]
MAPLGTCAAVAPVGQSRSVPTVRTGEVVSDATNVLALEAALLRRAAAKHDSKTQDIVHLASTHRVVRPRAYAKPGLLAHFALSAMVSAGRDRGSFGFEAAALHAQIGCWLTAYRRYFGPKLRLGISYTLLHPGNPDARLEALRTRPSPQCRTDRRRRAPRRLRLLCRLLLSPAGRLARWRTAPTRRWRHGRLDRQTPG